MGDVAIWLIANRAYFAHCFMAHCTLRCLLLSNYTSVGSAEARVADLPGRFAIVATVRTRIRLCTHHGASGAGATAVEPVAIGIQAILHVFRINLDAVVLAKLAGMLPGRKLETNQLKIGFVVGMAEYPMGNLMKERPSGYFWLGRDMGVGDRKVAGRPVEGAAFDKCNVWIISSKTL